MEPMLLAKKRTTQRRALLAITGAALGVILFYLCYGATAASVTNDAWIWNAVADQDILQHYAGWLFYREAPLAFPLGGAASMQYPSGVGGTLTYADAVPLAGIFFRLLAPLLPATFQYFGLWVLLCYALTGAAAALLLSLFLASDAWGNVCVLLGTCLFVLSPAMADRAFRHTALTAHFFILFALYLYFKDAKDGHKWRFGWPILAVLAMTVHPYFLPMIFAVLFAALLTHAVQHSSVRVWLQSAAYLCGCAGAALLTGACIGAFSAPAVADNSYGFWTMNLNALLNPAAVGSHWSRIVPKLGMTNGNIDGFNYLGLGVLLFGAVALFAVLWGACTRRGMWQRLFAAIKRHWALVAVCAALSLFAVSSVVTLGGRTLFVLPLPAAIIRLCSVFRASGRMFWPVGYLLLLCCVVFWARRKILRKNGAVLQCTGALCLAVLLCLQACDLAPGFADKRARVAQSTPTAAAQTRTAAWDALAGKYAHLFSFGNPLQQPYYVALWAAANGMTTNDPFTARYDGAGHDEDRRAEMDRMMTGVYDDDALYFTCDFGQFQTLAEALLSTGADVSCAQLDNLWYVIIPNKSGVTLPPEDEKFVLYPHFPLTIAPLTDALWTDGVLNGDKRTVLLYDSAVTSAVLSGAEALVCEGAAYPITTLDYGDAGWVMVTLDITDASILVGKQLTKQ